MRPSHNDVHSPGARWLITDRTLPAWTRAHAILADREWHSLDALIAEMQECGLAYRTVLGLIRSATVRRWVSRDRGRVRLRDDFADQLCQEPPC